MTLMAMDFVLFFVFSQHRLDATPEYHSSQNNIHVYLSSIFPSIISLPLVLSLLPSSFIFNVLHLFCDTLYGQKYWDTPVGEISSLLDIPPPAVIGYY